MSRRYLGSLIAGLALLVMSCSQAAPSAPPAAGPAPAAPAKAAPPAAPTTAAAPVAAPAKVVPKGKLTAVSGYTQQVVDPHVSSTTAGISVMSPMFEGLVVKDPQGKLAPALAVSYTSNPDNTTYEFKLRKGVKFHNGDPFTAQDVKFSMERLLKPENRFWSAQPFAEKIDKIEVVDDSTVVLRLKKPWPILLDYLDIETFAVVPKGYVEKVGDAEFGKNPVGTGPFLFKKREVKQYTEFEAFDGYWGSPPGAKTLILREVVDDSARLALFKSGEADVVEKIAPFNLDELRTMPNVAINSSEATMIQSILLYGSPDGKHPVNNNKVRQALNYALDKDALVKNIFRGGGTSSGQIAPPWVLGHDQSIKPYPYDVQKAKQLLVEAGYPNGFDIGVVWYPSTGQMVTEQPPVIQNYWAAIGVKSEPRVLEVGLYRSKRLAKELYPVNVFWPSMSSSDLAIFLNDYVHSKAQMSGYYAFEGWDEAIEKADGTMDRTARGEALRTISRKISESSALIPIWLNQTYAYRTDRIASWVPIAGARFLRGLELVQMK